MTAPLERIQILRGHLAAAAAALSKVEAAYDEFLATDFVTLGRKNTSAIVIAEYLVDYYTCLETLFLRVSQHFENELPAGRWHSELLERMALRIEGVREPLLDGPLLAALRELMKFRHFRRYYFELEYDWDKLEFLQGKFAAIRAALPQQVGRFEEFLRRLAGALGE